MKYVRFVAAFLIYTIIDVGWNLSPIATGMYEILYESPPGPAALIPIDILIGGLLSLITSTAVTAAFILCHRNRD